MIWNRGVASAIRAQAKFFAISIAIGLGNPSADLGTCGPGEGDICHRFRRGGGGGGRCAERAQTGTIGNAWVFHARILAAIDPRDTLGVTCVVLTPSPDPARVKMSARKGIRLRESGVYNALNRGTKKEIQAMGARSAGIGMEPPRALAGNKARDEFPWDRPEGVIESSGVWRNLSLPTQAYGRSACSSLKGAAILIDGCLVTDTTPTAYDWLTPVQSKGRRREPINSTISKAGHPPPSLRALSLSL